MKHTSASVHKHI